MEPVDSPHDVIELAIFVGRLNRPFKDRAGKPRGPVSMAVYLKRRLGRAYPRFVMLAEAVGLRLWIGGVMTHWASRAPMVHPDSHFVAVYASNGTLTVMAPIGPWTLN